MNNIQYAEGDRNKQAWNP